MAVTHAHTCVWLVVAVTVCCVHTALDMCKKMTNIWKKNMKHCFHPTLLYAVCANPLKCIPPLLSCT